MRQIGPIALEIDSLNSTNITDFHLGIYKVSLGDFVLGKIALSVIVRALGLQILIFDLVII